jgi:MftR C-terminal domain
VRASEEIARVLAERNCITAPDLGCRAVATAALGTAWAALESWAAGEQAGSMADAVTRGVDAVIDAVHLARSR